MTEMLLWSIGSSQRWSDDLVNNYATPLSGAVVWRVPLAGQTAEVQGWPAFHPSEADPDGGYRLHPYTIEFDLASPPPAARLRLHHLITTARLGYLRVQVNSASALVYCHPTPSTSDTIWLMNGLHSSIYAEGVAELIVPGQVLNAGVNRLVLTCHDGASLPQFVNPQKLSRLDRIATGAGVFYQAIEFYALARLPATPIARALVKPSVVYQQDNEGRLVERCRLYLEFGHTLPNSHWTLDLSGSLDPTRHSFCTAGGFGHVSYPFDVPDGDGPIVYRLSSVIEGQLIEVTGEFTRRRKWQVYVTPHAHTDIGYTHRQWEVAERLGRNLDAALELLGDADTAAPSMAYHLDASWALETYLKTRSPERIAQLQEAIRQGRIGLAGNYGILLSHFAALEDHIRNHELSADFLRPLDTQPTFDAVVDVPTLTSALPDVLDGAGIRYLVLAANQDRGPSRLNGQLHRRSPFYWQGRAGGKVLMWWAKMYCELRKVCGSPPDLDAGERGLNLWLDEFDDDYLPDSVLLYGQEADNTDLDPQPIDFVHAWNAAYTYPRLVLSDVASFFERIEGEYGAHLPTLRGDMGAFWEDGVGSSMDATIRVRRAQAALPAAERLAALAIVHQPQLAYPLTDFDAAWRDVLLYDEHTWGAFLSGSDPDSQLQDDQWAVKEGFAHAAEQQAMRLLHSAVTRHTLCLATTGREVVVFNPHSWPVSGAVRVEIGRHEAVVDPHTGLPVPRRVVRTHNTQQEVELWVENLAGLSYRRYGLQTPASGLSFATKGATPDGGAHGRAPLPRLTINENVVHLENKYYRLTFDLTRGWVTSWVDKALDRELVDTHDKWGFGQLLYVQGGAGTRLESNRASWPAGQAQELGQFDLHDWHMEDWAWGSRLRITGQTAVGRLAVEWRLGPNRAVDVQFTLEKEERPGKEAVYIAFPLALPQATVSSDAQLGWVNWNTERLPGACLEWLPLQTGIHVADTDAHVVIASPDIPLFCVGDRVQGRWPRALDLSGGRIFSYVLNNYWSTNYKPTQGGTLTFRYRMTSDRAITPAAAYRLGWEARQPLYSHRISLQEFRQPTAPYMDATSSSLAQVTPIEVAVTTLKAARHAPGLILRLQETGGAPQTATVAFPNRRIIRAWATDLLERPQREIDVLSDGAVSIDVSAWGLATLLFEVAR